MPIYVHKNDTQCEYLPGDFVLYHTDWNDWWTYENLYTLKYISKNAAITTIGQVKIGQLGSSESPIPELPDCFEQLDSSQFISLGQDPSYYDALNHLALPIKEKLLNSLNDIAFNTQLLYKYRLSGVVIRSLLRDIPFSTVENQFNRIARGGAILTPYHFEYHYPQNDTFSENTPVLDFQVEPESNPPSNIHVLIGRNGVGKTWLIQSMIKSLYATDNSGGQFVFADSNNRFSNVVCLAFSVFDVFPREQGDDSLKYTYIGVKSSIDGQEIGLEDQFAISLTNCMTSRSRYQRWKDTINVLDSDPIFSEINLVNRIDYIQSHRTEYTRQKAEKEIKTIFGYLSSGHKIVALTITRLVEPVEECTLVLLDEPELHLHPPLLAAFTRALSQLLINRNGVAIVATHSPVVLQETPKSCVWILRRSGTQMAADRPEVETFGENAGILTSEVFRLEVMDSGFHKMLTEVLRKKHGRFDSALHAFNGQLGSEALALLKVMSLHFGDE